MKWNLVLHNHRSKIVVYIMCQSNAIGKNYQLSPKILSLITTFHTTEIRANEHFINYN